MPNMDRLHSTRHIHQIVYSGPIVALTAIAEDSNVKYCIEASTYYTAKSSGLTDGKPIREPILKQVLERFATIPKGYE
jgi:osomolarity two-component system, sensor histidine kinase SLN1